MKGVIILLTGLLLSLAAIAAEPVNVNTADAQTIAENLNGVGLSKAQAIVAYRKTHGDFKHVDELINVKGIGLKLVDRNRGYILVSNTQPRES